jgi:serine/threonine-protein phosphatase CPPED1
LFEGIKAVFCGHYHRNAGGFYKDLEVVTTTAIGAQLGDVDKSGMRVVKVFSNEIQHDYYPFKDFPDNVEFQ